MIRADTGFGKTRLVQEFYRALSATADPDDYWPATLIDVHKAMTIIPTVPERTVSETPPLPWLWLALRCSNPGERNQDARGDVAFEVIPRQLQTHLAGLYRAQLVRSRNAALARSMISVVASFALPGSGLVLDAIERGVKTSDTALDYRDALDAVVERVRVGSVRDDRAVTRVLAAARSSLADTAVGALRTIAARRQLASAPIPIALVVDDAHWADPVTIDVLDRILDAAWQEGWPLLTIICAWDEALAKHERDGTQGTITKLLAHDDEARFHARRPAVYVHRLAPLDVQRMCELVKVRLPGLSGDAAELLARRCSGDLDLLYDFVDELREAPGWLNASGALIGQPSDLERLPSQAATMARRRLRTIGARTVDALSLASAEGIEFHVSLVKRIGAAVPGTDEDLDASLAASDVDHGITQLRPHAMLEVTGEFRRHIYWEVCADDLARSPDRRLSVLRALAEALRDLVHGGLWAELSRQERGRLGTRLLEIVDELGLDSSEWEIPRSALELDLAATRLDLGDATRTIELASGVLARPQTGQDERAAARRLLVGAAVMLGDVGLERRFLDDWLLEDGNDPHLLLGRAAFLLRQSAPSDAVAASRSAFAAATPGTPVRILAATGLAHALWSAGQPESALEAVATCEHEEQVLLESDAEARVAVDHSLALIFHDLEANLRAGHHARRCVDAYRSAGRLEPELISRVNLGDALWGAGRMTEARTMLEDACAHAEAAGLPHAQDIAAICLANVLASDGQHDRALELYDRGIELGLRIGHDWDEMYGRAYRALCAAEHGAGADPNVLLALADRARECDYQYLACLASAHAPMAAFLAGDVTAARKALAAVTRSKSPISAPGPSAALVVIQVLLATQPSITLATQLLNAISRCEGLKGRLRLAVEALRRVSELKLLDPAQTQLAARWERRFAGKGARGAHD